MKNQAIVDKIYKLIEETKKVYLSSAGRINADYNSEVGFTSEYKGRQLYELLQNADDEATAGEGKIKIELREDKLIVSNTGKPFSVQGIYSLMIANNSPKKVRKNMIGNKGLGFRSVLNWADTVRIATREFAVEFSRGNAIAFLKSLFVENPRLREELNVLQNEEFPIATLSCPKIVSCNVEEGYDTTIIIDCKTEDVVFDVKTQIEKLRFEELILLPNLACVEVVTNNCQKVFEKIIINDQVMIEERDGKTNQIISCTTWDVYKKRGKLIDKKNEIKDYELILAYDNEMHTSGKVLYSYFKTDVKLSFPAIIHGPFELSNNRNQLDKNNVVNKQLISALAELMVETAVKISEKNHECNYSPLELLVASDVDESLQEYNLNGLIYEKINNVRILPTIAEEYVSFNDFPKYSKLAFCNILNTKVFNSLLKICTDQNVERYIETRLSFYDYDQFVKLLNQDLYDNEYSVATKCNLMELIKQQFPYKAGQGIGLLVDQYGNNIAAGMKAYLPSKDDVMELPQWVNVRFLNDEMARLLNANYRSGVRNIANDFANFGITEYNFNRVFADVISQLKERLTVGHVNDVLIWIFKYYKSQQNKGAVASISDAVYVIIRGGLVKKANECYFGSEYKNYIGEDIISTYSNNFIEDYSHILECEDLTFMISFFEWLGVSMIPKDQISTLNHEDAFCYLNAFYMLNDKVQTSEGEKTWGSICNYVREISISSIEHIDQILKLADTNDIIAIFLINEKFRNIIYNKYETSRSSYITFRLLSQRTDRFIKYFSMYSYVRYLLMNSEWIMCADGNKHLPTHCCFENNNLEPVVYVPVIDYKKLQEQYDISINDVKSFLGKIGVAEDFTDLSQQVIYDTFLKLPDIDTEFSKGRVLYSKMKEYFSIDKLDTSLENYKKFIRSGKVLAKIDGVTGYKPVKDVFYLKNKIFSEEILRNFNLFCLDCRNSWYKAEKLFGITPLTNVDVKLITEPKLATVNKAFNKEYSEYCSYVLASRLDLKKDTMIRTFRNLKENKVLICERADFEYILNGQTIKASLHRYETIYIEEENITYICVPDKDCSILDLKGDIAFADVIAELVMTFLGLTSEKEFYRELFYKNDKDRIYLMKHDKGDEDLSKLSKAKELLELNYDPKVEFWSVIAELCKLEYEENPDVYKVAEVIGFGADKVDSIEYSQLNSYGNFILFIEIFQKIRRDVSDFNAKCSNIIDIRPYWKNKFSEIRHFLREQYRYSLYVKQGMTAENFGRLESAYDSVEFIPENSVYIDIDAEYEKLYGISVNTLQTQKYKNIDNILAEKKKRCSSEKYNAAERTYGKAKAELWLLFDMMDSLFNCQEVDLHNDENKREQNEINDILHSYITYSVNTEAGMEKGESASHNNRASHKGGSTNYRTIADRQMKDGMIGEKAVYQMLSEKYGKVSWISGIAQELGFVAQGNDTCGYDMTYYINKEQRYVEVKASKDEDISFHISRNEIDFARENKDNYELYYVRIIDSNAVEIVPLKNPFIFELGEDLFNNSKFTVENKEYYISAKLVKANKIG